MDTNCFLNLDVRKHSWNQLADCENKLILHQPNLLACVFLLSPCVCVSCKKGAAVENDLILATRLVANREMQRQTGSTLVSRFEAKVKN